MSVPGVLNYFIAPVSGEKAYTNINVDPITKIRDQNWAYNAISSDIRDARGKEDQFTLDTTGFEFHIEPTQMSAEDFDDERIIREKYYPEQIELIKARTGASKVLIFDHTIRRNRPDWSDDTPTTRTPVTYVHVDQTPQSLIARLHRHLPSSLVPSTLTRRHQIINLWRPIRSTVLQRPLALCDVRTVKFGSSPDFTKSGKGGDFEPTTLVYPEKEKQGETWSVKYSPDHRWFYWRAMTPDQFILIKCMDSINDGSVALCAPHTSFEDPTTPPDAPTRESIELRALVFYD